MWMKILRRLKLWLEISNISIKNGEVVDKLVGAVPKSQILEKLEAHM